MSSDQNPSDPTHPDGSEGPRKAGRAAAESGRPSRGREAPGGRRDDKKRKPGGAGRRGESRDARDEIWVVGRNAVREALERGDRRLEKVMLQHGLTGTLPADIRKMAGEHGIPVQYVPKRRLDRVSGRAGHQGVVAVMGAVAYRTTSEALAAAAADFEQVRATRPVICVLDGIEDPHNLGAILRSALASGVRAVITASTGGAPLSPAAVKASAGAALRLPIARAEITPALLGELKERGYWVVGTAADAETEYRAADWDRATAVLIGSEGRGIRAPLAAACDTMVSIPLQNEVESLNASVAAGLLLFAAAEARKER